MVRFGGPALTALLLWNGAAAAKSLDPDYSLELGVATQHIGKGLGKSDEDPAIFGTFQVEAGRFYASAWGSTAKLKQGGDAEVIFTIGATTPKVAGFELDLSIRDRHTPGTRKGYDSRYVEYQADISRSFGRASARLRLQYSPDGYGPSKAGWWNEAQVGWKLTDADKLTAAVARRTSKGGAEYTAWNVGVKHKVGHGFVADLRFYDTDKHELGSNYDDRLVATLARTF